MKIITYFSIKILFKLKHSKDVIHPALTGSKPPPQDAEKSEEDRQGITARKSPIGESFPSVGNEAPTDGSSTLYAGKQC